MGTIQSSPGNSILPMGTFNFPWEHTNFPWELCFSHGNFEFSHGNFIFKRQLPPVGVQYTSQYTCFFAIHNVPLHQQKEFFKYPHYKKVRFAKTGMANLSRDVFYIQSKMTLKVNYPVLFLYYGKIKLNMI